MTISDAPAVREALRRLLADALERLPTADGCGERVGRDARELARVARRDGVPVERLLVALKDDWRAFPGVAALPYREARVALSAIVERCIDEFYRDTDGPLAPEARPDERAWGERRAAG